MTAVEWLIKQTESLITIETFQKWQSLKEQAKAMEKEQIIDAYNNGDLRSAELYYNETYVKSKTPPGEHCEEA
jgi:hypothetical protein